MLFNVTLCYIAIRYLFSCNLLWFDAFHYTDSFNHKLYAWRGTLKSSYLLQTQPENPHYWFSQPKSSIRLFGLSHTSTTSVLFKDLRLARAASCDKKETLLCVKIPHHHISNSQQSASLVPVLAEPRPSLSERHQRWPGSRQLS